MNLRAHLTPTLLHVTPQLLPALRLWVDTWRVTVRDEHKLLGRGGVIYALWHGRMFAAIPLLAHAAQSAQPAPITILTAPLGDAQVLGKIAQGFGANIAIGSTGMQGARGLLDLARRLKQGHAVCLMVDGPAGPAFQARSGAAMLSRMTGAPIVPLGVQGRGVWVWQNSWDKLWLPLPGASLTWTLGSPLHAPAPQPGTKRRAQLVTYLQQLQQGLEQLNHPTPSLS